MRKDVVLVANNPGLWQYYFHALLQRRSVWSRFRGSARFDAPEGLFFDVFSAWQFSILSSAFFSLTLFSLPFLFSPYGKIIAALFAGFT
ncbi:MAG: hypothetical protein LBQ90_00440 [Synergistaceae bacterium]|jgi:hypothetical protein|nr:hypothetical protein [Synergistaceae bacterium]